MDRTAQEHAHLEQREAQRFPQGGVDHHHDGAQEVDAHDREGEVAVGILVLGQHGRRGHRRRRTANAGGAAGEQAEILVEPEQAGGPGAEHDCAANRGQGYHDWHRAAFDELAEGQAGAQEGDADTQESAAREFEAGLQHGLRRQRLQRHADDEREDQRRHPDGPEAKQASRVGVVGHGGDGGTERDARCGAAEIVGCPEPRQLAGDDAVTHRARPRAGLRRLLRLR